MNIERIYADFHKIDDTGRLVLCCYGTKRDLAKHQLELRDGLTLTFYMDDGDEHGNPDNLIVQGVVQFNKLTNEWVAEIDWEQMRHESELVAQADGLSK
ncbi:MAG: hypothetical protein HYR56_14740 [Acidobacteria bacterium]|nr:hypothetical protein [Acidobacteriota bacterium]MBI3425799.1 hypothetical protein [Acidobacteriota bacterium]